MAAVPAGTRSPARGDGGGWATLSPTERVIVDLVIRGLSNPQIARELTVSVNTIKTHLKHVFRKVGVATRSELAARAVARTREHPQPEE